MCVDFKDCNKAYPKDPYPLPSIDRIKDGVLGFNVLISMDFYSSYNQIRVILNDVSKPVDTMFSNHIARNLEVYINGVVNKTLDEGRHKGDIIVIQKV